jgi:hypothetical protein
LKSPFVRITNSRRIANHFQFDLKLRQSAANQSSGVYYSAFASQHTRDVIKRPMGTFLALTISMPSPTAATTSLEILACEQADITVTLPKPMTSGQSLQ